MRPIQLLKLLTTVFLLACLSARGQNYKQYTVNDGLPSNQIYSQTFDKSGYIWLATPNGLCRFDGFQFQTYTTKDGLTDNDVVEVFVDNRNRIWALSADSRLNVLSNEKIYTSSNCSWVPKIENFVLVKKLT